MDPYFDIPTRRMIIHMNHSFQLRQKASLLRAVFSVLFCTLLQGCATPSVSLNYFANELGFQRSTLHVKGFDLLVYKNSAQFIGNIKGPASTGSVMHVYLEGDGSPWRYRTMVMPDPTPRNPMMLRLMALDEQPSFYLGRPCYNGTSRDSGCDSRLWTSGRYSSKVVDSMAAAINVLAKRYRPDEVRLFGHSGGGALALLLAHEIALVTHVVTVAGNLDTDAWTAHHGYTPLYSSLNPAKQPSLRPEVNQWHFLGGRDTVVPAQLIKPFVASQAAASGFLYGGYDHGCCWVNLWPTILNALDNRSAKLLLDAQFKSSETSLEAGDSQ
ncbi:MAG: pimeloyl-ACP methyl ester carboxylesterase [Granulosicoccus sp.]